MGTQGRQETLIHPSVEFLGGTAPEGPAEEQGTFSEQSPSR